MNATTEPHLMRVLSLVLVTLIACSPADSEERPDRRALTDTLASLVANAYRLSDGDAVMRIMSLYPERGEVVSAAGGRITTTRDSLDQSVRQFWEYVGANMREPRFIWRDVHVRPLGEDAAVLTGRYAIPHRTPAGRAHIITGAWTAVFERRDGRWVIVHEHLSDAPDSLGAAPTAGGHTGH